MKPRMKMDYHSLGLKFDLNFRRITAKFVQLRKMRELQKIFQYNV